MKRKIVIPVAIVLAILGLFLAVIPMQAELWYISVIAILLFGAPVVIYTVQWLGRYKGLALIGGLGIYALLIETFAIQTGMPYGQFSYGGLLGPKLFDSVPVTVLLAWTPLVLGVLAVLPPITPLWKRVIVATVSLVVVDMVLDPAAVHIGFWAWDVPGFYYGVPLVNFAGWVLSGGIAFTAIIYLQHKFKWPPLPLMLGWNLLAIVFLWTMVNLFALQMIPAVLGLVVCGLLYKRLMTKVK